MSEPVTTLKCKKKKKFLTYLEQSEVIEKLKAGKCHENIMREYNISESVCYKLHSRKEILSAKINSSETKNRKTSKSSENPILDKAMIKWFQQVRDKGDPVFGPLLQEKALIFNEKLNLSPSFKASSGWLKNFKKRYGIQKYTLKGEKLSNDSQSAINFSDSLKIKIDQENISLDNIYNADESGIYWKTVVSYTLSQQTDDVAGRKQNKERVTALFCANASGNHQIPLLIIGKSATPGCLGKIITPNLRTQHLKYIPIYGIIYTHQTSAWMDANVFRLWYTEVFIPSVREHQKNSGKSGKVVLLLDNAPSHPDKEELNAIDTNFEVLYLPLNVTAIIQPMDQGAISLTKKNYKKSLLKSALFYHGGTVSYLKQMNLCDCFINLKRAWESLKESTLNKIWKPLLGESCVINHQDPLLNNNLPSTSKEKPFNNIFDESETLFSEIFNQFCQNLSESEHSAQESEKLLTEWYNTDDSDVGWGLLTDDEIVNFITSGEIKEENLSCKEENENSMEVNESDQISASEAFEMIEKLQNYASHSTDFKFHHQEVLEEVRNIIKKQIESSTDEKDNLNLQSLMQ